jgi:glyoxylase-like metal-dependent hydrolase (beta-lactamase superfamily II)
MQSIAKNVYIEDQYLGVVLGAIDLPHGLIQIDAPPSPDDGRAWRATLMNLESGPERLLINLDAHPDRTLGARTMECTIIAHDRTAQVFRSRPNTFKAGGDETGSDWEAISGLGNIRWAPPEISFTHTLTIQWDPTPVMIEHHPGPSAGACWVILPQEKIVFVGDAVLNNQPPFLSNADIPVWLETINLLLAPEYKGYKVVSGRNGLVSLEVIRAQRAYLKHVQDKLQKLADKKGSAEAAVGLATSLLSSFKASAARQRQYAHRLRYGLSHYYTRHFHSSNSLQDEE